MDSTDTVTEIRSSEKKIKTKARRRSSFAPCRINGLTPADNGNSGDTNQDSVTAVPTAVTATPTTDTAVPTTDTPAPTTDTAAPNTDTAAPTTETAAATADTPVTVDSLQPNPLNIHLEDSSRYYEGHIKRLTKECDDWDEILKKSADQLIASHRLQYEPKKYEEMTSEMQTYYNKLTLPPVNYTMRLEGAQTCVNRAVLQHKEMCLKVDNLQKVQQKLERAVDRATANFCEEHMAAGPDTPRTLMTNVTRGPRALLDMR